MTLRFEPEPITLIHLKVDENGIPVSLGEVDEFELEFIPEDEECEEPFCTY